MCPVHLAGGRHGDDQKLQTYQEKNVTPFGRQGLKEFIEKKLSR